MAQMLLVNPKKRRRKKSAARKVASNPKKRRSSRKRKASASGRKRRSISFRRNPLRIGGGMVNRVINNQLKPAAIQAGGALAVDVAFGYLGGYLPPALSSGMLRHVTKAAGAILLSTVAANVIKSSTANEMAKGALTVVLHDVGKELAAQFAPSLPLSYYGSSPVLRLSAYTRRRSGISASPSTEAGGPARIYQLPNRLPSMALTGGVKRTGFSMYQRTGMSGR